MTDKWVEPLPHWASARSDGTYMQLFAQLPTKDGRRMGNATIYNISEHPKLGKVASIFTDAGNTCRLIDSELKEIFYPPKYIGKEVEILEKLNHFNIGESE